MHLPKAGLLAACSWHPAARGWTCARLTVPRWAPRAPCAGLWEAGSARWRAPLQAPEERELGSLKAEALDVAQETARTARGIARSAAALQRSLKDPAGPLQVRQHL